jgi:hypothetical protein
MSIVSQHMDSGQFLTARRYPNSLSLAEPV